MDGSPRTLADQLRAWSVESVVRLLRERPDLALPAPADSAQLAARATTRPSVTLALDELTTRDLDMLALVAGRGPIPATEVPAPASLDRLRARALVWGDDGSLRAVSVVADLLDAVAGADAEPPTLALSEQQPERIESTGAGAAAELVRRTEAVLDHWGRQPPPVLRGGGLGVRELRALARLLRVEPAEAALVVELAHAAGLLAVGMTDELDAAWLPTDAYDGWLARSVADRWTILARAWLTGDRLVSLVGGRMADKPVNALAEGLERSWLPRTRREALLELGGIEPGQVLAPATGVDSLLARLRWLRPRRPQSRAAAVIATLSEAAVVGVTGLGGMPSYARPLLAGDDPARLLGAALPDPVDYVLLQADLTAVAPGPLTPDLARELALVAEVESSGGGTVYRFTQGSVRRAFDAGWAAVDVHELLARASRTPVPQPLTYLVDDVARRFGTIRAGYAEAYVRSDDPTALTELLHHADAERLRLRRLAPTVLVTDVPLATLLPRLRELGLAPAVEAADGTLQVARPDVFRARTPRQIPVTVELSRSLARAQAVATAVRAGDRAAALRPTRRLASRPADVVALLRESLESGGTVLIGYVGNDGFVAERVVSPRRLEGGRLTAYDERSDDVREFALHRITGASPGPD